MADFKSSIQAGMAAYQKALADHGEIGLVVRDLAAAIATVTEGRAELLREDEQNDARGASLLLLVSTRGDAVRRELARLDSAGLPLRLSHRSTTVECRDIRALERALGEVVSTACAGRMLVDVAGDIEIP